MKTPKPDKYITLFILILASYLLQGQQIETSIFVTANTGITNGLSVLTKIDEQAKLTPNLKFYPHEGCPIKITDVTENEVLIMVDSQWFLEDWNNHIYINSDCEIKNRTLFFMEFESMLKKSQDKMIMVAIHHPVFSNTREGLLDKLGGISLHSLQNKSSTLLYSKARSFGCF